MRRRRLSLVVIVSLLAVACQRGATVEGVLSNGDAKGSFQKVSLVRNAGDSVTSAIDALCAADGADVQQRTERIELLQAKKERFRRAQDRPMSGQEQVAASDSVEKYRLAASDLQRGLDERPDFTTGRILALLAAVTDTQVETNMQGQFRFAKRQPGKYLLYVEWLTDRGADEFLVPVDASGGGTKRQNIDPSTVSTRLRCR
jgi:hypothetical protein